MGSSKTVASVVEYRLEKEKKSNEMNPKVTTLGVGYDRTLGGFELTLRMRDHLVEEFRKTFKTDVDVMENPRAMRKLLKEADRVKQVLSANPEHYAQLESVHEGQDFRIMVTRDQLEKLMIDMEPRMVRPIVDALKMAELSVDQVDQVVLMGAGTRVPKVQAVLQEFLKGKELGKFLNTDEAIAMGAVYQAAHLSKGFKVKKFGVEDLQIFPVQVDFQSLSDKSAPKSERTVHRPIFGYKSHYPTAKKILSFTSYKDDFSFNVTYGELKHLSDDQLKDFGSRIISEIKLTGITEIMEKELSEEGSVYKGVKAHFRIDDSGIVYVEGAEVYIEKKPKPTESAFASLAGKITGLFSSGSKGDDEKSEEQKEEDKSKSQVEQEVNEPAKDEESLKKEAKDEQKDSEKYDKKEDENIARANEHNTTTNGTQQTETQKHEPKETKPEMLKVSVKVNEFRKDVLHMEDSDIEKSQQLLKRFEDFERAKRIREQSQNELESLIYEVDDKIEQDEYKRYTKEDEMILIKAEVKRIRSWLDDDVGPETETDKFRTNRRKIDDLMKPITLRMREEKGRPKVVAELLSLFNHSELFLALSKNLTDSGIFTEVEISTLENVLNSTKDWWTEKSGEQEKLGPTDTPAFTIDSLKLKIAELDREVKYLLNKIAIARAKDAAKEAEKNKMETKNTTASTEERTNETDSSTVSNETIEESVEVSPKPVEGGDNATIEPEQDSEVKVSESAPQESDQVHDREEL
ncbi:hypothetical protein AB6A40_005593 [Gnathostoma spinigerum]|uniref:Hypoxia up-regulated protein 1 n=1 Tax=Gnathostoma spinigerum TaxID=75299 RepID=A0ABD6EFV4_9BILA